MIAKKLTKKEVKYHLENGAGYLSCSTRHLYENEDDVKDVVVNGRTGFYLVPLSEIEYDYDTETWKLSKRVYLAIGGFPEDPIDILMKRLNISYTHAIHLLDLESMKTDTVWAKKYIKKNSLKITNNKAAQVIKLHGKRK